LETHALWIRKGMCEDLREWMCEDLREWMCEESVKKVRVFGLVYVRMDV